MININNKPWDKLRLSDIEKMLTGMEEENFFFEFKSDEEDTIKLIKEISAFANTYGGYIFLGINDDKTISGCRKWDEQRIHSTIRNSITPIPNFDVKKFKSKQGIIYVIKVEEGITPPYVTNRGYIYERISSGSFPIKESSKLIQLYNKRNDQLVKIKNKIENSQIEIDNNTPENICAYIDLGFSVVCKNVTKLQKNFFNFDFGEVTQYLRTTGLDFSISRIGASYVISIGTITASDGQGKSVMLKSGLQNFIEIMMDGSVKSRIVISCNIDTSHADITSAYHINRIFEKIYNIVFGEDFSKAYLYAHKYERLTVLKQFTPICSMFDTNEEKEQYLQNHRTKYGGNLIVDGTRLPKNDYILIDKSYFDTYKIKYNNQNLIYELFYSYLFNLGYIDLP